MKRTPGWKFIIVIFAMMGFLRGEDEIVIDLVNDSSLNDVPQNKYWSRGASTSQCQYVSPGRGNEGNCIMIDVPDKNSSGTISWQYNTPYIPSYGQGRLHVSFWAKTDTAKSLNPEALWDIPYFRLIGHTEEKGQSAYENFTGIRIPCGSSDWTKYDLDYTLPEKTMDLAAVFRLQNCTGKIWVDDFSMTFMPVSEMDKKKAIKIKVMGDKEMNLLYSPRSNKADPALESISEKDREKGFIVFHRKNPRDLYPDSIPQTNEITTDISFFATPGEYEPAWIGVYALKNLKNFNIHVSDLNDGIGNIITREHIRLFSVKCWPQGSTSSAAGDDSSYSIIPEILIERSDIDIPDQTSQNFYLLAKIPENSKPGFYKGRVSLGNEENGFSELTLTVRVLPFKLETPSNMKWLVHTGGNFKALREAGESPVDAAEKACRDIKNHGIEGISIGCGYGDTIRFQEKDGRLQISSFPQIEAIIPAMKKTGMKGPLIIHFGDMLEYQVAKAMNFDLPQNDQKGGVSEAMRKPEFENAFKSAIREVDVFIKILGGEDFKWYFEGVDEPGCHSGRQERALWEWRLATKAGIQGAVYMHGPFWKKLAPYNYIQIFSSQTFYDKDVTEKLQKELKQANNVAFQYGASGTYGTLPGGLMPSRWGTGFFAYITKVDGQISWLYSLHKKNDPEKLEHMSFYPLITYVTPENGLCGTLQWEGIREGIDDYRYIATLDKLIEKAKGRKETNAIACDIENKRDELLNLVPWIKQWDIGDNTQKVDMSEFDNDTVSKLRWQIAVWIMDLNLKLN